MQNAKKAEDLAKAKVKETSEQFQKEKEEAAV